MSLLIRILVFFRIIKKPRKKYIRKIIENKKEPQFLIEQNTQVALPIIEQPKTTAPINKQKKKKVSLFMER